MLQTVAQFSRVTDADRIAGEPLHRLSDRLAAHGARYDRLDIGDVQAVAGRRAPVDVDVDITPAGQAFGQGGGHARYGPGDIGHLGRDTVHRGQVRAGHLDADGALDARRQHVDAISDGRDPDVGQSGDLNRAIEFFDQFFRGHARPPFIARLELDGGLEHLQRSRIRGGFRPARLAEHGRHFGHGADHPVRLLQQFRGLGRGETRLGRRHIQQVALVHRRHEFAAELAKRPGGGGEDQQGCHQGLSGMMQHPVQWPAIDAREPAIDRIALFGRDPSADQIAHQNRHESDGQDRRRRHRIALGKG
ncbi:hypothetical protein BREV_BREV_02906 [Brevundimonas mediterranea]|uniref:Uncharacterized protein n=1 Tax=Brevundimonas mediterranea TaxID=74329 RepID=A0A7Z8Y712_9CAUL|nr:hypothetical protein BREV_BREV_02906 [Brevundimonas mediterranea]